MSKTPAQRFDDAAKTAVERMKFYKQAKVLATKREELLDESTETLREVVKSSIGFDVDDVVVDEFDNLYRVTKIHLPSFYLTRSSQTRKDIGSFTDAMSRVSVEGLLLNKSGVPTWQKSRTVRGKLRRYEVGE